jgi:hypothetical protein
MYYLISSTINHNFEINAEIKHLCAQGFKPSTFGSIDRLYQLSCATSPFLDSKK